MLQFFNQILKLPLSAFAFSMEMFVKTMQGMQRLANQGIDAILGGVAQTPVDEPRNRSDPTSNVTISVTDGAIRDGAETTHKEETNMDQDKRGDKDLSGKELKLVKYKILFVKRDYEYAFPEQEDVVADDMDGAAFTAWKVGQFVQHLDKTPVPGKWKDKTSKPKYPPEPKEIEIGGQKTWVIGKLPEEDKKYLRVYYQVLERYPREPFKHEERQIEVLEEIRDKLGK